MMSLTEEKQFSKTTHCDRPCIKLDNHASKLQDKPQFFSLHTNLKNTILPNALLKSI